MIADIRQATILETWGHPAAGDGRTPHFATRKEDRHLPQRGKIVLAPRLISSCSIGYHHRQGNVRRTEDGRVRDSFRHGNGQFAMFEGRLNRSRHGKTLRRRPTDRSTR